VQSRKPDYKPIRTAIARGDVAAIEAHARKLRYAHIELRASIISTRASRVNAWECVHGQTWGFQRNGIWVTDGCSGLFDFETR
jgi:hypothetical protein